MGIQFKNRLPSSMSHSLGMEENLNKCVSHTPLYLKSLFKLSSSSKQLRMLECITAQTQSEPRDSSHEVPNLINS